LELWLGILIVTEISLIGWLLTNIQTASGFLLFCGFVTWLLIGLGCAVIHRQIKNRISQISEL
jgi:hypothetical protein